MMGRLTEEEAWQVLNVTDDTAKKLLSQVHPDKHLEWQAEAVRATARVNQAMDIHLRHVAEV